MTADPNLRANVPWARPSPRSKAIPFVRIAAGTEHRLELETLADAFGAAPERISVAS